VLTCRCCWKRGRLTTLAQSEPIVWLDAVSQQIKTWKGKERGAFEEKETIYNWVNLRAVKWLDNWAVTLLSTFASANPATSVTRWDKKKRLQYRWNSQCYRINCSKHTNIHRLYIWVCENSMIKLHIEMATIHCVCEAYTINIYITSPFRRKRELNLELVHCGKVITLAF